LSTSVVVAADEYSGNVKLNHSNEPWHQMFNFGCYLTIHRSVRNG